jgi:opacity protein-like surface antigen
MVRSLLAALTLVSIVTAGPVRAQRPEEPPQERLGARLELTGTTGELNRHYGQGYDITLYFTERILRPLYLDVHIGATYLGDVLVTEIDDRLTHIDGVNSEMRLAYLTLGPQLTSELSETHTLYVSLGAGIYSVSILFDTGVQAFGYSDQHFGVSAGAGMYWRITDNWNIDVNATVQTLWTDSNDLYPIFTEGDKNPLLLAAGLGVALNLR